MDRLLVSCVLVAGVAFLSAPCSTQSTKGVPFKCSAGEVLPLQRRWAWLQRETTPTEKATLHNAILQYLDGKPDAQRYFTIYHHHDAPLELIAYRQFSYYGMYINAYLSPDVYTSICEHLVYTKYENTRYYTANYKDIADAQISVLSVIFDDPSERMLFRECFQDMHDNFHYVLVNYTFRADCDVGTDKSAVRGHISFSQRTGDYPVSVQADLTGVDHPNRKYVMYVHDSNTCATPKAASGDRDSAARFTGKLKCNRVSLHDPENIMGKTLVIYEADGEGLEIIPESAPSTKTPVGCCVVNQIY